jgi:hypothetical protein
VKTLCLKYNKTFAYSEAKYSLDSVASKCNLPLIEEVILLLECGNVSSDCLNRIVLGEVELFEMFLSSVSQTQLEKRYGLWNISLSEIIILWLYKMEFINIFERTIKYLQPDIDVIVTVADAILSREFNYETLDLLFKSACVDINNITVFKSYIFLILKPLYVNEDWFNSLRGSVHPLFFLKKLEQYLSYKAVLKHDFYILINIAMNRYCKKYKSPANPEILNWIEKGMNMNKLDSFKCK